MLARLIVAGVNVQVVGLFPGKAIIVIDGQRSVLSEGESRGSVKVVKVFRDGALLDISGTQRRYSLTREGAASYAEPADKQVVRLLRHPSGHYVVTGEINDIPISMLLDTGATILAMNEHDAQRLGIDYKSGEESYASTANGVVKTYRVMLRSVSVKGLEVQNVMAAIIPGAFPDKVLLGMSYLKEVNMREVENGILLLEAKF